MRTYSKVMNWLYVNDWRWFTAFLICQITFVGLWFVFALWISDYARLNWY